MPKRYAALILALLLLCALTISALAATDLNYSGPLDNRTNQPLEEGAALTSNDPDSPLYTLEEGVCDWSRTTNQYLCYVGSQSFSSNIPPDALTQSPVSFQVANGLSAVLYQDGDTVESPDFSNISEPGSYVLDVTGSKAGDTLQFKFSILPEMVNNLIDYTLPAGFVLESVTVDGQELFTEYKNYVQLDAEGKYQMAYTCEDIGQRFSLDFTLDRTAPEMEIPDVVDGVARGAVTLTITEEMSADKNFLVITAEDGTISRSAATTHLKVPGDYQVSLYDQAGNHSDYQIHIPIYLNISAVMAILLVALAIGGVIFYSRWMRRHVRVG